MKGGDVFLAVNPKSLENLVPGRKPGAITEKTKMKHRRIAEIITAEQYDEVIKGLLSIALDKNTSAKDRLKAMDMLSNRIEGLPVRTIQMVTPNDTTIDDILGDYKIEPEGE